MHETANASLSVSGNGKIIILGGRNGPSQVNSKSTTAVSVGIVNLSQGEPNNTGSDLQYSVAPQPNRAE